MRIVRFSELQFSPFFPHPPPCTLALTSLTADDDSNKITLTLPPSDDTPNPNRQQVPAKTTWTLLLYLTSASEGCTGGETVFYPHDRQVAKEAMAVAPETGMLLLHKHGNDCMLHEGREVTAGEKWIIRTDLCVARGGR